MSVLQSKVSFPNAAYTPSIANTKFVLTIFADFAFGLSKKKIYDLPQQFVIYFQGVETRKQYTEWNGIFTVIF